MYIMLIKYRINLNNPTFRLIRSTSIILTIINHVILRKSNIKYSTKSSFPAKILIDIEPLYMRKFKFQIAKSTQSVYLNFQLESVNIKMHPISIRSERVLLYFMLMCVYTFTLIVCIHTLYNRKVNQTCIQLMHHYNSIQSECNMLWFRLIITQFSSLLLKY